MHKLPEVSLNQETYREQLSELTLAATCPLGIVTVLCVHFYQNYSFFIPLRAEGEQCEPPPDSCEHGWLWRSDQQRE